VICASVNDVIVHGIPDSYRLRDGDLVSIDCGAELDGWTGDAAVSFIAGTPRAGDQLLIETTEKALAAGIAAAVAGARIGDISHAVGSLCRASGYGIPSGFGGHGIGRHMHEDPEVRYYVRPGTGTLLRPGMTIALEPMVLVGTAETRVLPDQWTVVSADGSLTAHFEHTVAVTDGEPEILTRLEPAEN